MKGKPANGFRISKTVKVLMAQGYSLEEAVKMRDSARNLTNMAAVVGRADVVTAIEPAKEVKIETPAEILKRITARFTIMRKMVRAAAVGDINSVIISGPPGLGKSFETYDELKKIGVDLSVYRGRMSPVGLHIALYHNRRKGSVIVLDDVDVFSDEKTLDALKAATDTTGDHVIRWGTQYEIVDDGESIPNVFTFEGTIVFITNNDFRQMVASGSKLSKHLEALMSRSHYIDLGMKNRFDFMVRIRDVAQNSDMLDKLEVADDVRADILDYIDEHKDRFDELSLRMVHKLASMSTFDDDWRETAKVTLMRNVA